MRKEERERKSGGERKRDNLVYDLMMTGKEVLNYRKEDQEGFSYLNHKISYTMEPAI